MSNTTKVFTTGRFGSRYGVGIRKKLLKVEVKQKEKFSCPECCFDKVKRISKGVYYCKKCELKFAGGAYIPITMTGNIIRKMVTQKSFLPALGELTSTKPQMALETPEEKTEETQAKTEKKKKKEKKVKQKEEKEVKEETELNEEAGEMKDV